MHGTVDRAQRKWHSYVITEEDYVSLLQAAGLLVEVFGEMDYFAGSVNASTRRAAHSLGAHAIVMRGRKPETTL